MFLVGIAKKLYAVKRKDKLLSAFISDGKYKNAEDLRNEASKLYNYNGTADEIIKGHTKVVYS